MPDQSSAADEHALLQEITEPLASLSEEPLRFTADVEFPTALRGYERMAVDEYVRRTSRLVAELQTRNSPQGAIRRALERVGEDVSGILQRAHETAEQVTAQSRSDAEDRVQVAREEASRVSAESRKQVKELDADTDRIWEERERIVADARDLARQLIELADAAAAKFPGVEETRAFTSADVVSEHQGAIDEGTGETAVVARAPVSPGDEDFDDEEFAHEDGRQFAHEDGRQFAHEDGGEEQHATAELQTPELPDGADDPDAHEPYAEDQAEPLDAVGRGHATEPRKAPRREHDTKEQPTGAAGRSPKASERHPFDVEAGRGDGHDLPGTLQIDATRGAITARRIF